MKCDLIAGRGSDCATNRIELGQRPQVNACEDGETGPRAEVRQCLEIRTAARVVQRVADTDLAGFRLDTGLGRTAQAIQISITLVSVDRVNGVIDSQSEII